MQKLSVCGVPYAGGAHWRAAGAIGGERVCRRREQMEVSGLNGLLMVAHRLLHIRVTQIVSL